MRPLFSWRHAILESDLPAITRHVLLTLSCHMTDAGDSCFPSVTRLERETGLSRPTVIKHLKIAKDRGWILVGIHGFGGQRWKSHEYTVATPEGGKSPLPAFEKGGKDPFKGGKSDSEKAVKEVNPNSSGNSTGNSTLGGKRKNGRQRDEVFEALVEVSGLSLGGLTKSERGRINKARKELVEVGATPEEIRRRAKAYRERWPRIDLTPSALVSNWSQIQTRHDGSDRKRKRLA